MIILDTNVLSELMRHTPDPRVVAWLDRQPRVSIWTTSITVLEIQFGLQVLPAGKRRVSLLENFEHLLRNLLEQRVAAFDGAAAQQAADLMELRRRTGRQSDREDAMIAGIAVAHHAMLATRTIRRFTDLSVPTVNPWHYRGEPPEQ